MMTDATKQRTASSYEPALAKKRTQAKALKQRLHKAQEKEAKRYLKIAKSVGLLDYTVTDDEIREVFGELLAKKSQAGEGQSSGPFSKGLID